MSETSKKAGIARATQTVAIIKNGSISDVKLVEGYGLTWTNKTTGNKESGTISEIQANDKDYIDAFSATMSALLSGGGTPVEAAATNQNFATIGSGVSSVMTTVKNSPWLLIVIIGGLIFLFRKRLMRLFRGR